MRIWSHGVRMLVAVAIAAAAAGTAHAEELKWLGVHGAYFTEYEKCALGINARQDLGHDVSAGFLLDYVFQGNHRETMAASADVQWETVLPGHMLAGWVGGGMGLLRDNLPGPNRKAEYEAFGVVYTGVGLAHHPVMPYVELRLMSHEVFHGVVYAGLRF